MSSSTPSFVERQRVLVHWGEATTYAARVVELRYEERRVGSMFCPVQIKCRVHYELDGQREWHNPEDLSPLEESTQVAAPQAESDECVVLQGDTLWRRLELQCCYSLQSLTEPARLLGCTHASCCNYESLKAALQGGSKVCPVSGCTAKLLRSRDVVHDSALSDALARLPNGTSSCWVRGYAPVEIRLEPPPGVTVRSATEGRGPSVGAPWSADEDEGSDVEVKVEAHDGNEGAVLELYQAAQRGTGDFVTRVDGLQLHTSDRQPTGYKGVAKDRARFRAQYWSQGKHISLGTFDTAVEAAIAYARHVQQLSHGDNKEEEEVEVDLCEEEEEQPGHGEEGRVEGQLEPAVQAMDGAGRVTWAGGFELHLSDKSASGYRGVRHRSGRFRADHGLTHIGQFDTAVQAAVAYARHLQLLEELSKEVNEPDEQPGEQPDELLSEEGRPKRTPGRSAQEAMRRWEAQMQQPQHLHASAKRPCRAVEPGQRASRPPVASAQAMTASTPTGGLEKESPLGALVDRQSSTWQPATYPLVPHDACANCGLAEHSSDSRFCRGCGHELSKPKRPTPPPEPGRGMDQEQNDDTALENKDEADEASTTHLLSSILDASPAAASLALGKRLLAALSAIDVEESDSDLDAEDGHRQEHEEQQQEACPLGYCSGHDDSDEDEVLHMST